MAVGHSPYCARDSAFGFESRLRETSRRFECGRKHVSDETPRVPQTPDVRGARTSINICQTNVDTRTSGACKRASERFDRRSDGLRAQQQSATACLVVVAAARFLWARFMLCTMCLCHIICIVKSVMYLLAADGV